MARSLAGIAASHLRPDWDAPDAAALRTERTESSSDGPGVSQGLASSAQDAVAPGRRRLHAAWWVALSGSLP